MERTFLEMAEVQKVSLTMMKKIAEICERKGFRYFLYGGTLLGAVRHKGFIPWDDDIDIGMPRPDYEKFCSYCKLHEKEIYPYRLFNMDTVKGYPYMIGRMSDDRYKIEVQNEDDFGMGIFVDIYPLDGLGNTEEGAKALMRKLRKYPRLMFLSTRQHYQFGTTKGWKKRLLKIPAFLYAKFMGKNYFKKKILEIVDLTNYENSKFMGCAVWGSGNILRCYDKNILGDFVLADFEDTQFRIPENYDYFLTIEFGDYMKLPPVKDRIYHHLYMAYKK